MIHPIQFPGDTLAQADLLAQQYDYDKAIDLLKNDPAYGSYQKMQAAVKEYEDKSNLYGMATGKGDTCFLSYSDKRYIQSL